MPENNDKVPAVTQLLPALARAIDAEGVEYAIGGAIALAFWSEPRGTADVDVTLFLPPNDSAACVRLLQQIGCVFQQDDALKSVEEHGYCQVHYSDRRLDVFLPIAPFYVDARLRRKVFDLDGQPIQIWDAETLCVFKMMFFRRKDIADVEQILRSQGNQLDVTWISQQLDTIYGTRDPRVSQWQDLVDEVRGDPAEIN